MLAIPVGAHPIRIQPESGFLRPRLEPFSRGILDDFRFHVPIYFRCTADLELVLLFHHNIVTFAAPRPHGIGTKEETQAHPDMKLGIELLGFRLPQSGRIDRGACRDSKDDRRTGYLLHVVQEVPLLIGAVTE